MKHRGIKAAGLLLALAAALAATKLAAHRTLYGHRAHAVAPPSTLTTIDAKHAIRLAKRAATALTALRQAARADGIDLIPLSGYRDLADQQHLFTADTAPGESPAQRARLCAPPGFSEHHTGLAVDLADASPPPPGQPPATFGDSPGYRWLVLHGHEFGFEQSFQDANTDAGPQPEPWHWRYVGDWTSWLLFHAP